MFCPACRERVADQAPRCPSCGQTLIVGVIEVLRAGEAGESRALRTQPVRIGRALENELCISDGSVSRFHARLVPLGDGFALEDLGSTQGSFVNERPIEKRVKLAHGDLLRLGDVRLRYAPPPPELPEPQPSDLLLQVVEALNSTLSLPEVADRVLDGVIEITNAERGFLLLVDPPEGQLSLETVAGMHLLAARSRSASGGPLTGSGVSTSVIRRVRETGTLVATGDALSDPAVKPSDSMASLSLRTIVCLPLKSPRTANGQQQAIGAIYVDNHVLSPPFSPQSLRTAEALARSAALAIENARFVAREEATIIELRAARDKAFEASRAKSIFLANMSHELHTPLNAILGYAEFLQEKAADLGAPELLKDLRKIKEAGRHLLRLIDDVLDVSQLEEGTLKLGVAEFEVAPALNQVLDRARPLIQGNGNSLEIQLSEDLGVADSDPRRLRQVLFGLLANAAKFTEKGIVRFRARRQAAAGGDLLEFQVEDTGIGMTAEQAAGVFDLFSQADPSDTRKFGGMGLGLALGRRLTRKMGGDLAVESAPGKGSTFTMRIPVRLQAAPE